MLDRCIDRLESFQSSDDEALVHLGKDRLDLGDFRGLVSLLDDLEKIEFLLLEVEELLAALELGYLEPLTAR